MELWNVTSSTRPVRLSITPVGSIGSTKGIVLTATKAYIGKLGRREHLRRFQFDPHPDRRRHDRRRRV